VDLGIIYFLEAYIPQWVSPRENSVKKIIFSNFQILLEQKYALHMPLD
jgi:hypothetical protein